MMDRIWRTLSVSTESREHDFTINTGWGRAIHDIREGRIGGHSTPRPNDDDIILRSMQSGKTGRYKLSKVEYCRDPQDMWFADAEFVGYK